MAEPEFQHKKMVELQDALGIGNAEIAAATGKHINTVSKWRGGTQQPDAIALDAMARVLRTTTTSLLHEREPLPDSRVIPDPLSTDKVARPLPRVLRTQKVRVWLSEFRTELTKAGESDDRIHEAVDLVTAPQAFSYHVGGATGTRELSEDEAIVAMEAIARFVRQRVKQRRRQSRT